VSLPLARDLNLLARGDLVAKSFGVRVARLRGAIYILASALTAAPSLPPAASASSA
jgi:iron complex transport system permease protein